MRYKNLTPLVVSAAASRLGPIFSLRLTFSQDGRPLVQCLVSDISGTTGQVSFFAEKLTRDVHKTLKQLIPEDGSRAGFTINVLPSRFF